MDKINNIIWQRIIREEKWLFISSFFTSIVIASVLNKMPFVSIYLYLLHAKFGTEHLRELNNTEFKLTDEYLLFLPIKKKELIKGYFIYISITMLYTAGLLSLYFKLFESIFDSDSFYSHYFDYSSIIFILSPAIALITVGILQIIAVSGLKTLIVRIISMTIYTVTFIIALLISSSERKYANLTDEQIVITVLTSLALYYIIYKIALLVSKKTMKYPK